MRLGVLILLAVVPVLVLSCKKDESFHIEGKWGVESVSRQGLPLEDHAIRRGDEFEFKSRGEYVYRWVEERSGQYEFNKEEKRLVLDGVEYFVYVAQGKELTFGLLQLKEDIFTVALRAQ